MLDTKVIGVFVVVQPLDGVKSGDAGLLKMFASQIGVMLKNCDLYQAVRYPQALAPSRRSAS